MNFLELLWGTIIYRPYVYVFFLCFLVLGGMHLGWKRLVTFLISSYLVAFAAEYSSTRNGIPFGLYTYIETTRDRELWISNVPFWDSLSFVFLSYFSWVMAAAVVASKAPSFHFTQRLDAALYSWKTPLLGGLLMMLLDVVIDPITLQGDRWFLGAVYFYPNGGPYFGVTLENFLGWFVVGFTTQWLFQFYLKHFPWCRGHWPQVSPKWLLSTFGVYAGCFLFMLGVTLYVGDLLLAGASTVIIVGTCLFIWKKGIRGHLE